MLKKCSGCQASKPLPECFKDVSRSDGLQPQCKVCRSEAKRNYAKRNRTGVEAEDDKAKEGADDEQPQKRSKGDDLYVFRNSRLPEYKIGRSSDASPRSHASQNFYMLKVAIFEGKGHLEGKVREMLAYCLLPREVAAGTEWHACSLQTALAAIGQAIESEEAK